MRRRLRPYRASRVRAPRVFPPERLHGVVHRRDDAREHVETEKRVQVTLVAHSAGDAPGHVEELPRVFHLFAERARATSRSTRRLRGDVGLLRVRWGSVRARGGLPPRCGGCGERRERRGGGGRGVRRERRSVFVVFVVFVGVVRVSGFAVADAVGGTRLGERAREGVGGEEERFVRSHGVSSELVDRVAFVASARAEERVPAGGGVAASGGAEDVAASARARDGSAGDGVCGVAGEREVREANARTVVSRVERGGDELAARGETPRRARGGARRQIARGRETVRAREEARAVRLRLRRRERTLGEEGLALLHGRERDQRATAALDRHARYAGRGGAEPAREHRARARHRVVVGGGGAR